MTSNFGELAKIGSDPSRGINRAHKNGKRYQYGRNQQKTPCFLILIPFRKGASMSFPDGSGYEYGDRTGKSRGLGARR
ncbi:MAG TPA: hypothetical protein VL475_07555, partial [Planctomycetaceae bacterium]|nr:hypothetical protein [Planctomycetaceae bacterium]